MLLYTVLAGLIIGSLTWRYRAAGFRRIATFSLGLLLCGCIVHDITSSIRRPSTLGIDDLHPRVLSTMETLVVLTADVDLIRQQMDVVMEQCDSLHSTIASHGDRNLAILDDALHQTQQWELASKAADSQASDTLALYTHHLGPLLCNTTTSMLKNLEMSRDDSVLRQCRRAIEPMRKTLPQLKDSASGFKASAAVLRKYLACWGSMRRPLMEKLSNAQDTVAESIDIAQSEQDMFQCIDQSFHAALNVSIQEITVVKNLVCDRACFPDNISDNTTTPHLLLRETLSFEDASFIIAVLEGVVTYPHHMVEQNCTQD